MAYQWRKNYACTSVFAILRSKNFLNQRPIDSDFEKAGDQKLGLLTYYPRTNNDPDLLDNQATMISNMFVNHLDSLQVVKKIKDDKPLDDVKAILKELFKEKDSTLKDIAECIDNIIEFFDE